MMSDIYIYIFLFLFFFASTKRLDNLKKLTFGTESLSRMECQTPQDQRLIQTFDAFLGR